jgi:tetratricopeptide (TPR) repeat protein
VCLACFFNEAVEAEDTPSESVDGGSARVFSRAGPLPLPCEFAGYRLLREIASGGMGVVYEAEDSELKRTVALKMIRLAAFARQDEITRFRAEAEMAAQLEHPNIVPIHDVGESDGIPFFTMRLVAGMSLAQRLSEAGEPLSPHEAAIIMVKTARAVQHAHARGVLHRDLKPGNILLDERGEPHLTDFGLAKLLDDDSMLTRTTAQLGTPHYMSPEQAAGRVRQITTASDVWALGVLLHQLLTLRLPFTGESSAEIMRQVTDASPVALDLRGMNADLATLVQRCLEKEPSKRPPSAGFLADELERWQNGGTILSRPVDAWERGFRWVRRNKALAAAVALTASGLVVGSGVALWQRQQAVAARDQARRELKDAEAVTGLMVEMLKVFDDQHGGPVTTKDEIVTEFLKQVEAFEGDPRRQIALITSTGTLLEQEDNSRCYERAVEIAQRTLPPDDPQIWYLRWRAASTKPGSYNRDGRLIPELRTVYEWHRDHLGLDDPQTIRAMESLARRLVVTGGEVEALGLLEKVRAVMEQRPEDPPVSRVKFDNIYMQALFRNGRHEEALSFGRTNCRRAVHEINPEVSHETARFCHMLAKVSHEFGQTAEAVRHLRQALDIYWKFEGPANPGAMEVLSYLLALEEALHDDAGLLATQRDALRAFDMALGPSRSETQQQVAKYAQTLVELGRVAEADALFTQWLDRLRGGDGTLVPQAAKLEQLLAEHLKATGR